jgi:hypothetical protein
MLFLIAAGFFYDCVLQYHATLTYYSVKPAITSTTMAQVLFIPIYQVLRRRC